MQGANCTYTDLADRSKCRQKPQTIPPNSFETIRLMQWVHPSKTINNIHLENNNLSNDYREENLPEQEWATSTKIKWLANQYQQRKFTSTSHPADKKKQDIKSMTNAKQKNNNTDFNIYRLWYWISRRKQYELYLQI